MTRFLLVSMLTLAGLGVTPASAQEPWKASYYPYLLKGPNDKLSLVLHYQYGRAAPYTDVAPRVPFDGSLSAEVAANADGSRSLVGRFKAPQLADGWRFQLEAGAVRDNRFGYFGMGNDAPAATDDGPRYETRVGRSRWLARADVTRRLVGPLHLTAGAGLVRASYRPLPGTSRFSNGTMVPMGCPDGPESLCLTAVSGVESDDATARLGLVLDTRDSEYLTTRGVVLEAGVLAGSANDGYRGTYASARAYVPIWMGAVLAGRVMGRHLSKEAPLDARYAVEAWERAIPVLGGPESHRSFVLGRYTGRDLLLANLEFRQTLLDLGDFGAVGVLAFLDAGRAVEGLPGESRDLHVGGGAGLTLRILRSTVLGFNFAGGGDGYRFSMGTGWAF